MNIIQIGRINDGLLHSGQDFKQGDILKIETENHTYTGEFLCFDRTYWKNRPQIILKITDDDDQDITNLKIRCFEIQKITKYQEAKNDKPRT